MASDAIAIIVPVLGRPHRVAETMATVAAATTVPYRLLFVVSPGDAAELAELAARGADVLVMDSGPLPVGDYAAKINAGYRATSEPYIFTGADDLRFHLGWDTAALAAFREGIGVVGTDDLGNPRVKRGDHSTHSLVARWYADQQGTIDGPGAIYVECYPHEFVDDEMVETAKSRGAWAFCAASKVEHLHPNWGKAPSDHLHAASAVRMRKGHALYQQRRKRWGAVNVPTTSVAVIVATYGDEEWKQTAERAVASVRRGKTQPAELVVHHGENLAEARNVGARQANAPWLCFLDADDELDPGYLTAMSRVLRRSPSAGLLNPAVRFVTPQGKPKPTRLFRPKPLDQGNYLVIGTLVRSDLFWQAEGFDPQWPAWEDWQLWRRVMALGGKLVQVRQAVYIAHERMDGRNNTVADKTGLMVHMRAEFDEWSAAR